MVYRGGKGRFGMEIANFIKNAVGVENKGFISPFCGGCNVIQYLPGERIANDINPYLIAMWQALICEGWTPPNEVSKETYLKVKEDKDKYPNYFVGWIGFICSFRGLFFNGYAPNRLFVKYDNKYRDCQSEQAKHVMRQIPFLKHTKFTLGEYSDFEYSKSLALYCDPPYANTKGYGGKKPFDNAVFWEWVRHKSLDGYNIFISEYQAPKDFVCVWQKKIRGNFNKVFITERLFIHESSSSIDKHVSVRYNQLGLFSCSNQT